MSKKPKKDSQGEVELRHEEQARSQVQLGNEGAQGAPGTDDVGQASEVQSGAAAPHSKTAAPYGEEPAQDFRGEKTPAWMEWATRNPEAAKVSRERRARR